MKPNEGELQPLFEENLKIQGPVEQGLSDILIARSDIEIPPLPSHNPPWRILLVDDDDEVIKGLETSQEQYVDSLELRFWSPGKDGDKLHLVRSLAKWRDGKDWFPNLLVLDINMDEGGESGFDYLTAIRSTLGFKSLPLVLATGNQVRDLDGNQLQSDINRTGIDPSEWADKAWELEPDALLYSKTASAQFLHRLGEQIEEWQKLARRRTWISLLRDTADLLDKDPIKVNDVADFVASYLVKELSISDALIRWRKDKNGYQAIAYQTVREAPILSVGDVVDEMDVPILGEVFRNKNEPIVREQLLPRDAGKYGESVDGCRFLGFGLYLGSRPVGTINLLRMPGHPPFEKDLDGVYLVVLARLLVSALGREQQLLDRQTGLLDFANDIALSESEEDVCEALVELIHREMHQKDDQCSKTTVRLLQFGQAELIRKAERGLKSNQKEISLKNKASVYGEVVRTNVSIRLANVCEDDRFHSTCDNLSDGRRIQSEYCAPLSIGSSAIGALNLEHIDEGFYQEAHEGFVQAAANLAAGAIERIRNEQLLQKMAELATQAARIGSNEMERQLERLLFDICGHDLLIDYDIGDDAGDWRIRKIQFSDWYAGDNREREETRIRDIIDIHVQSGKFVKSWVYTQYQKKSWKNGGAAYTADEDAFLVLDLDSTEDSALKHQKADAVLWLDHLGEVPQRALILLWFLPPPIGERGIRLLGELARLFSEVHGRQREREEMIREKIIGEQAQAIGHVMQHFRHRFRNLTGLQITHLDELICAKRKGDTESFEKVLDKLQKNTRLIANSFAKSKGYIKAPDPKIISVDELVERVIEPSDDTLNLTARLNEVQLEKDFSIQRIKTDPEIASLVLYSLVENSLDVLENHQHRPGSSVSPLIRIRAFQEKETLIISVSDNGPGIVESMQKKLFQWGETTKKDSLGSALAFAKTRMQLLDGDLLLGISDLSGASFEMHFFNQGEVNGCE